MRNFDVYIKIMNWSILTVYTTLQLYCFATLQQVVDVS